MEFMNPTIQEFKDFFYRDFPYGEDVTKNVTDQDIAKAFMQVNISIRATLFCDQAQYTMAYLYLAAHFLVENLKASTGGIYGTFKFLETSKSVGSVSQSFGIPTKVAENPSYAMYMADPYGAKYLSMIYNRLVGNVTIAPGRTHP